MGRTRSRLAVGDDAATTVSGRYWHNLRQQQPEAEAIDAAWQDRLLAELAAPTGVTLPWGRDERAPSSGSGRR